MDRRTGVVHDNLHLDDFFDVLVEAVPLLGESCSQHDHARTPTTQDYRGSVGDGAREYRGFLQREVFSAPRDCTLAP